EQKAHPKVRFLFHLKNGHFYKPAAWANFVPAVVAGERGRVAGFAKPSRAGEVGSEERTRTQCTASTGTDRFARAVGF
ncbi:MAG: hypothetical protein ACK53F_04675, partial [Betaproteobacteria bacterium]